LTSSPADELAKKIQEAIDKNSPGADGAIFLQELKRSTDEIGLRLSSIGAIIVNISEVPGSSLGLRSLKVGESQLPDEPRYYNGRFQHRSTRKEAYIDFTYPALDEIWEDVKGCTVLAAIASVVSAILAEQVQVARATFYPTFYGCLVSRLGETAKKVGVDFHSETVHGPWHNI